MDTSGFHPLVDRWFRERFREPTAAQAAGWKHIAAGRDTLIAAPTGSGKTLAAFLWAINMLVERASAGSLENQTNVVYVSPLKALANDIQKNLQQPLAEIRQLAEQSGTPLPDIRVFVRSGDTPAHERQSMVRKPPHILITTPESFYILLTAERSRRMLADAKTVIVDEIHAVAGDKRGAHLALSLERLDALAGSHLQRIGLSATQKPIDDIAKLLVGSQRIIVDGPPDCAIVDVGHQRTLNLRVEVTDHELGPIATHELYADIYERIVAHSKTHRTTIVFVNTRRLVERVSHQLAERLGKEKVAAHHGSLSRRTRLEAEEGLKNGTIPVVVATASLELGIDVGHVDLVCQLGSPRALATLLQRVGRSGHWLGAVPKGVLYPLTRDDLLQCAAAVRAIRAGELDRIIIPENARDILAQQIVAMVASQEMSEEEVWQLVRRAYPFRNLERADFEAVLEMLSEGVATSRGRRSAHLHRDQVHHKLRPRRGARLAAITSGGAIPDTADYDVIEEPAGTFVGKVNEDFAIESMAGDIFLLGNRSWRIRRVEAGRLRVQDAQGAPPTIPFWVGEAPARTPELSQAVAELREGVALRLGNALGGIRPPLPMGDHRGVSAAAEPPPGPLLRKEGATNAARLNDASLPPLEKGDRGGFSELSISRISPDLPFSKGGTCPRSENRQSGKEGENGQPAIDWLMAECGVDRSAAEQIVAYVGETLAALGAVPTRHTVIAERFFDEGGGMQLVLHAPFGGRINRAWGLALRKRFCRTFDFELQAAATDDGIVLSLGEQHSFPLEGVFAMISLRTLAEDLTQAALAAPMFGTRWRWNATRALALLRHSGGKRVPMPIQRMRAEDLLAAVFPAQLACGDNHPGGPIELPDHPLVNETIDNCLHEAMDLDGLRATLEAIERGDIRTVAVNTPAPSPMSHEILNANPYAFLDDAPLEERRARAVSLRRLDPDLASGVGALDQAAIDAVREQAWPDVRDADELHDLLLSVVLLPMSGPHGLGPAWSAFADQLIADHRAVIARWPDHRALVATERMPLAEAALPDNQLTFERAAGLRLPSPVLSLVEGPDSQLAPPEPEMAIRSIVQGWLECLGPVTIAQLAAHLGLAESKIEAAMYRLESEGIVLRGTFTPNAQRPTPVPSPVEGPDDPLSVEWCERRLLARIHRLTLNRLRREIEAVPAADLIRFLLRWQHVHPGTQLHGRDGVLQIITQLQGLELPAPAWERDVLSARINLYDSADLDQLCLAGEVAWGRLRLAPTTAVEDGDPPVLRERRRLAPTRSAPLAFVRREALPLLLEPLAAATDPATDITPAAQEVLAHLGAHGASFLSDIARATGRLPVQTEDALWELVARGLVTGDGIAGLRTLLLPELKRRQPRHRLRSIRGGAARRLMPAGRWSLLRTAATAATGDQSADELFARQLLRRYGIVLRELLAREARAPAWRVLLGIYRRLEARGEIRGGRFVAGFVGEQFALPEAVDALRAMRRQADDGAPVLIAAADPLNLVGILTPGARLSPFSNQIIAYQNGVPVEIGELGAVLSRVQRGTLPAEQS
jgi:ATP-dependent Lhr-like helicase